MNLKRWAKINGIDADPRLIEEAAAEANSLVRLPILKHRPNLAMTLAAVVAIILIAEGMRRLDSSVWAAVPALIVLFVAFATVFSVTTRGARVRRFRAALNRSGVFVCMTCGYLLRGLDDDVKHCPECGTPREAMP